MSAAHFMNIYICEIGCVQPSPLHLQTFVALVPTPVTWQSAGLAVSNVHAAADVVSSLRWNSSRQCQLSQACETGISCSSVLK